MHFDMKSTLKNNHNHIPKQTNQCEGYILKIVWRRDLAVIIYKLMQEYFYC